jgi:hypothetical protein
MSDIRWKVFAGSKYMLKASSVNNGRNQADIGDLRIALFSV